MRPAASDSDRAAAAGRGGPMLEAHQRPRNRLCRVLTAIVTVGCVAAGVMLWRAVHALFPDFRP